MLPSVVPQVVFEESQNRFRCNIPTGPGSLHHTSLADLGQQFLEFYVTTDPDPEDFADLFEDGDSEPIPELYLPTESECSDNYDSDDSDRDEDRECQRPHTMADRAEEPSLLKSPDATDSGLETRNGKLREPPTVLVAKEALEDLKELLHPKRKKGSGHTDPELNYFVRTYMEGMQTLLNFYTNPDSMTHDKWSASSLQASISLGRGTYCAQQLRRLVRQFIKDRKVLPVNPFGQWSESLLVDEDLTNEINIYLQSIGSEISGQKLMDFINNNTALRSQHGIEKKICLKTAQRYLNALGYRYRTPVKGQYADGHEREDVVYYRD